MYFSDVFNISNETLVTENVFDISLVGDLPLYPALANWYVAKKEATGDEAVAQSKKRVSRAADLYRTRILNLLSATLRPSGFFDVEFGDKHESTPCPRGR